MLASKGRVQVLNSVAADARPVKIGEELYSEDQVITMSEDYIGLVHKTGKTIEIDEPGVYKIVELEKKVPPVITEINIRLWSFIDQKMEEFDEEGNFNYKEKLAATAAVERALEGEINLLVAGSGAHKFFNDQLILRWVSEDEADSYTVRLSNFFGDNLLNLETSEEYVEVDLSQPSIANEKFLVVEIITDRGKSSTKYQIQRIGDDEERQELEEVNAQYNNDNAMDALFMAIFFEERGLHLDALTQYERAIQLSPEIEMLVDLRDQFIVNQGLGR